MPSNQSFLEKKTKTKLNSTEKKQKQNLVDISEDFKEVKTLFLNINNKRSAEYNNYSNNNIARTVRFIRKGFYFHRKKKQKTKRILIIINQTKKNNFVHIQKKSIFDSQ